MPTCALVVVVVVDEVVSLLTQALGDTSQYVALTHGLCDTGRLAQVVIGDT